MWDGWRCEKGKEEGTQNKKFEREKLKEERKRGGDERFFVRRMERGKELGGRGGVN